MPAPDKHLERWDGADATSTDQPRRWDGAERTDAGSAAASPRQVAMPAPPEDDGWHRQGQRGPLTGQVFADYEIGTVLGEGGMGMVYRARQKSLGRRVAVKTLASAIGNEPLQRARFEIEARAASLIQSPHVVAVYAAGSWDGTAYFVMEYVEGKDLGSLIADQQGGGLPQARALELALQAARGLSAAAAKGIVHRDIKPGNLLLTNDGTLKIADFGISRIGGDHNLTRTGTAVGTPSYLAPEQGRGDPTDSRSDIYSLGCVLYEMLTGRKPFLGENADAVIYQHNYAEPQLPRSLDPSISEPVQALVVRCLQKDPAKRYQDPDALIADITAVSAGDVSVTALLQARYGTGAEEQMRRRLGRRYRWALPLAAALVIAALAAGLLVWRQSTTEGRLLAQRQEEQLRGRLRDGLDRLQPVPPAAHDDLAALARLSGGDDADVRRWQGKLAAINALDARFARLHGVELPALTLRNEATTDLAELAALVGAASPAASRTEARLAETAAEIARLRQQLGEFDANAETTLAQRERLAPALDSLVRLVGETDAAVARWRRRVGELDQRVAGLRQAIAVLDQPKPLPDEPTLDRVASHLDEFARLRASVPADANELRWRATLATHRGTIARLRDHLARLDEAERPAEALLGQLDPELMAYHGRVLPDDVRLLRWQGAMESNRRRLGELRARCALLDRAGELPQQRLAEARDALADLRPLLALDDREALRREQALGEAEAALARWREALTPLADAQPVPLIEQTLARTALGELIRRQAIAADPARQAEGRLLAEERRLSEVRGRCRSADDASTRVSAGLVDDIVLYGRLMGENDADYKRWRLRIVDFVELRRRLSALDRAVALPDTVDGDLAALAALVSDGDAMITAWRSKVQRVRALVAALAVLETAAPPPERAEAAIDELRQLVGAFPQEPAWLAKIARVRRLEAGCAARLGTRNVLLAGDALTTLGELEAETGPTPATMVWRARAGVLAGPARPTWASEHSVDARGPRAVLRLPGEAPLSVAFRHIPAGSFTIGSLLDEPGRDSDELPAEIVLSRGRWMGECEVSQALYERITGSNPSVQRGPELPVHRLDWAAATAFAARFAELCKVPARLPSEAEWEHACRAGGLEQPELDRAAWYRETSDDTCHPIGRRPPNPLGLHDLLGNVWEWCSDRYGSYPPTGATDPLGGERDERVVRGGCWADAAKLLRPANRAALAPTTRSVQIGLRLVIEAD